MTTAELVTCPVEGCEWSIVEPDEREAKYQRELHEEQTHPPAARPREAVPPVEERHAGSIGSGKSITTINDELREIELGQVLTVRCADCVWEATGPQREARVEWAEHRRDEHGDDQAVEMVRRQLAGELTKRRRPGAPVVPTTTTLKENLEKTRRAGGGQSAAARATTKEDSVSITEWTKELAIERLLAFHEEHDRMPKQHELRSPLPGQSTLVRLFGSQKLGIQAAEAARGTSSEGQEAEAEPVKPPPAEEPSPEPHVAEPPPASASANGSLASLAAAVDEASTVREQALAKAHDAEETYLEALTALEEAVAGMRPTAEPTPA